ncbi:MAG TPA: cold shock domain-containing protein [Pseudomonadales bacterium]
MNVRNSMSVLATAFILTLLATLIETLTRVPPPIAYFAIALLAAIVTLMLPVRHAAPAPKRNEKAPPARGKETGNVKAVHSQDKEAGNVKWFSASKGFGFITRDNGQDIFVHFRSISGNGHRILREGQRVEFAVTEGSKGPQAEDVVAVK